jgi:hypothetical protein
MDKEDKKAVKIIMIFFVGVIFLFIPWNDLVLKNHARTCGFVYGQHKFKGAKYIQFSYKTSSNGWLTFDQHISDFKIKNVEVLKKMNCLKTIYSTQFNSIAKIIDGRVIEK